MEKVWSGGKFGGGTTILYLKRGIINIIPMMLVNLFLSTYDPESVMISRNLANIDALLTPLALVLLLISSNVQPIQL